MQKIQPADIILMAMNRKSDEILITAYDIPKLADNDPSKTGRIVITNPDETNGGVEIYNSKNEAILKGTFSKGYNWGDIRQALAYCVNGEEKTPPIWKAGTILEMIERHKREEAQQ